MQKLTPKQDSVARIMDVASYPPLPTFDGITYRQIWLDGIPFAWDLETSRRFYDWYLVQADRSSQRLHRYLGFPHKNESDALIDSLDELLSRLADDPAFTEEPSLPPKVVVVKGIEVEIANPPRVVTDQGFTIIFDCGAVFGNALLQAHRSLHYGLIVTKRKIRGAFEGLPVITGFDHRQHLYAPNIVLNCLRSYLWGQRGKVVSVYRAWEASVPY
jgi:hypothetical protein